MPIFGTSGNDARYGTNYADIIYGLGGHDVLYGNGGNDYLSGGDGNDTLYGGTGNDYLSGGSGNDILVGGAGADRLSGGIGADYFRMNSASDAKGDRIYDFRQSENDHIDVHNIDAIENKWWNPGTWGNQAFNFIHTTNFTGTAGELRYYHSDGNTYVQGSTDSDKDAEFTFVLSGTVTLQYWDFWL